MRGGAFFNGKEGRDDFRNQNHIIPPSHSSPDFSAYLHPVPYLPLHSKQAAAAEPRSAAEPAHSGFLEPPIIIRYFLQLQGTLHRHRIVHTTTQIQEVVRIGKHSGDILDYRSLLQYLLHFLRNLRKFLYHLIIVSKEATTHTVLQTVRLVINLLQHKVIKTTLAQLADVQIHGLDIVMTCRMLHNRSRITGDTLRTQPRHR